MVLQYHGIWPIWESKRGLTHCWLWRATISPKDSEELFDLVTLGFSNSFLHFSKYDHIGCFSLRITLWFFHWIALCLILEFVRNYSTPLSMNYFLLLKIKVLGITNWHIMFFQMNFWTFAIEMVVMGSTSICFMKWSILTRRNFSCPFVGGKGLSISTPQEVKGHGTTMVCTSLASRWDMLQNFRHSSYFFVYSMQSSLIVGQ